MIAPGDITNFSTGGNPPTIVVSGSTCTNYNCNITLISVSAVANVKTNVNVNSGPDTYFLSMNVRGQTKLPVAATLISGPNVAVPFDFPVDQHNDYQPIYANTVSPTVGDTYQFLVTYSDGDTAVLTAQVTAVLTSSYATNLAMVTTAPYSTTVPELTWTPPGTAPTLLPYTYFVSLNGSDNNWNYSGGKNSKGIPSSQTSVPFDVDQSASHPTLTTGTTYNWVVSVQDADGNTAQNSATYIP
jgi:hypothetical protein